MAPIPDGTSGWEIGAQRSGIRGKADDDFAKRAKDSLGLKRETTTFVFTTPQRFPGKDAWAAEKRALRLWRDVRVIDADDLVLWLETYPAVAQWLAVRINRRPNGLLNLEEVWSEWRSATRTPLTEDLILADRDDQSTAILKWLKEPPGLFSIQAEAPDEAIAFLYASISALPEPYRIFYWSRTVVATDENTARDLIGLGSPLIIVLMNSDPGVARRLADDGHHVYTAHGPEAIGCSHRLARPWRHNIQTALVRAGLMDEEAHSLSRASGRSVTVLRRLMPAAPRSKPGWPGDAQPELVAAMFAGAWDETSAKDRQIVSDIAGYPYKQVEAVLAPLAKGFDSPLMRSGCMWKVVSLRDLWTLIGGQVTPGQLERFEAAFHEVLGAVNPRFDAKTEDVIFEKKGQFGEEASLVLRRGLAEAMIALGVYPGAATLIGDAYERADRAIRLLLGRAERRLWWSLSDDFRRLAEASPAAFLEAVEAGLEGKEPPVMALFRSDKGLMSPREYLLDLLQALEMLARSPTHLARAALLLARMDEVDPGGKTSNRPGSSLRRIFVCWSPQTYASPDQRLKAIDAIVKRHPGVGWKLLVGLVPRFHDVSEPSPLPDWRDFTPDVREEVTWPTLVRAAEEIGRRLLEQAGKSNERWCTLLDLWANFDPSWRSNAAKRFSKLVELPRPLLKYARQASLVEQPTLPGLGLQYCCSSCA